MNESRVEQLVNELLFNLEVQVQSEGLREGLKETPARVAKAWAHWTKGYDQNPADILKVFSDGGQSYDEMVVIKDIPFHSHCEHHLAPFFGTVTLAYIPNEENQRIIGLSKASRLVDIFAQRLQVQERMTVQIADAMETHLRPLGVGVIIRAQHTCMSSRGISKEGVTTITSALRGVMKTDASARVEFLEIAK